MARGKGRRRFPTQRLAGFGCLIVLAGLVVGGYLVYQQLRGLLNPTQPPGGGDVVGTEDVPVTRGSVRDVLRLYGVVASEREGELAFEVAQGVVAEVLAAPSLRVRKGDPLIVLDEEALERALVEARATLAEAQATLAELSRPVSSTERLQLQVQLRQAKAAQEEAERALAEFDEGRDTLASKRAKAVDDLAQARYALAELRDSKERKAQIEQLQYIYNVAEVKHGPRVLIPNPSEQDQDETWLLRMDMLDKADALALGKLRYEMDIRAAEETVRAAERALAALDAEIAAGGDEVARLKLEIAVESAAAKVQELQAKLDALDAELPSVERAKAEAAVLKAEWAVADAEAALAESRLVAPFDGVISEVNVVPEAVVSPGTTLVKMLDPAALRVIAKVSDVDITLLKPGQEAQVEFEAFRSAKPVTGQVGEIPPFGTYQNGVTVFDVPVSFADVELPLMVGMGVNLTIPLAEKENVLVIPSRGVRYDMEGTWVFVVVDGQPQRRRIKIGLNDGVSAEVLEGLQEGEIVRVPLQQPIGPYGAVYG